MRMKKFFSKFLVLCMMLSMPAVSFGAETYSDELQQAILNAKKIITVPDSYTEFTYSTNEYEVFNAKVKLWNLEWADFDKKGAQISVSIDANGNIHRYNNYIYNDKSEGLSKFTKEQLQQSAEIFLKKAFPTYSDNLKKIKSNNSRYAFEYQLFANDIPVTFTSVGINVNKYTGEVELFTATGFEKVFEYKSLDNIIDSSTAKKAYLEKLGVTLKYYSYYDYKSKKMNIFAGYSPYDIQYKAIDAKTSESIFIYSKDYGYRFGEKDMALSGIEGSGRLTKEELYAVENISDIITKEKAENIIREHTNVINSDSNVKNIALNKSYIDNNKYIWNISFDNAYGQVNAKSGELISFNCYKPDKNGSLNLSKDKAQDIAENFLKEVSPDKFYQTKYYDNEIINPYNKEITETSDFYSFDFVRQVNGIDFISNSLSIRIDKTTGKVVEYNNTWYDNIRFPSIEKVMSSEEAFDKISKNIKFELQYSMINDNKDIMPVYNFSKLDKGYIIDPFNGVRLDYKGEIYRSEELPEYSDIKGHSSEKVINELLENDYYIKGEKFNPDNNITQINLLKYMYSPLQNQYTDDEFYNMLIDRKIITPEEKSPNAYVSTQDVARFIVRYLGYDKIATHSEIFIDPFKDNISAEYKGYATICYGLGIIKGDKEGNFNATDNITNAEAAEILYKLISTNN